MPARYQMSVVFTATGEPGFVLPAPTNSELIAKLAPFLQGAPGGPGGGSAYEHQQPTPSATWTINHNLGYRPSIVLLSVGGKTMVGDVIHTNVNQAIATFDQPTAGIAPCS